METLKALDKLDPRRMSFAPLLGLLAGFLFNRARDGAAGSTLLVEMALGAVAMSLGVALVATLVRIEEERKVRLQMVAEQRAAIVESQRLEMIEAETRRFQRDRLLRVSALDAQKKVRQMKRVLEHNRSQTEALTGAIELIARRLGADVGSGAGDAAVNARIEALEAANAETLEAGQRIEQLELAQRELTRHTTSITAHALREAEEVKASLRKLAISDSQRQRNIDGPENAQSGRLIDLEARIKRLAREIEKISGRQVGVAPDEGIASLVGADGTKEQARVGFLKAMLEANQTLRRQIKTAA